MDKASGEPALDDEGKKITASTTFTAEESCGTVDVTFAFAGASLAGKSLVAFETMEFEGAEYMVHADIDDVEQTVAIRGHSHPGARRRGPAPTSAPSAST